MGDFLKRFWAATASLAGIVGLYLGAVAVDLVWSFWLVIALAVLVAGVPMASKRALDIATRVRNYPPLLEKAAALEVEAGELRHQLLDTTSTYDAGLSDGKKEGRREILGILLANQVPVAPTLTASSLCEGALALHAICDASSIPAPGARYAVVVRATQEVKGIVEVQNSADPPDKVILNCVKPVEVEYWQRLNETAAYDPSPPPGVGLVPTSLTLLGIGQQDNEQDSTEAVR